ncbi:MAG: SiaB family protein kinase, partial [Bacteroidota bacterium]
MLNKGDRGKKKSKSTKLVDLHNLKQKDDLEYIFRGDFSPKIVRSILDLAQTTLEEASDTSKIKSKIYYIMGESLQNIARHNSDSFNHSPDKYSLFAIHKKKLKYFITTGNLIEINDIDTLKERIEKINSLEKEDLRNFSRTTRTSGALSDKGGAGLGLIEMAKRSGNKLDYDFKEINDQFSYFYLNTEIPVIGQEQVEKKEDYKYSIENIKELHDILVKDNVILFFKGAFNQSSLLNLLSIVENQLKESTITIKIYNIMVELLQNISKHADNYSAEIDWKPGIFLITEKEEEFVLISGNYIRNAKIDTLKRKLNDVNDLSFTELVLEYNRILQDFNLKENKKGLGLLDLKRKSKKNLSYSFHK